MKVEESCETCIHLDYCKDYFDNVACDDEIWVCPCDDYEYDENIGRC